MPLQGFQHKLLRGAGIPICVKEDYWIRISPDHKMNGLGEIRRVKPLLRKGLPAGIQLVPYRPSAAGPNARSLYYCIYFDGRRGCYSLAKMVKKYMGYTPPMSWAYYHWIRARAERHNQTIRAKARCPQRQKGLAKMSWLKGQKATIHVPYRMQSGVTMQEAEQGAMQMNFKQIPDFPDYAVSRSGLVKRIHDSQTSARDFAGLLKQPRKASKSTPSYAFSKQKGTIKKMSKRTVKNLVAQVHGQEEASRHCFNKTWTMQTREFVRKHNENMRRRRMEKINDNLEKGFDPTGAVKQRPPMRYYKNDKTGQEGKFRYVRTCGAPECDVEFGTNQYARRFCCEKCRRKANAWRAAKRAANNRERRKAKQDNNFEYQSRINEALRVEIHDPFGTTIPNTADMCPLG